MAGFDRVRTELYEKTATVLVEKTTGSDRTTTPTSHHPIDVTEACDHDQETSRRVVPIAEPPAPAVPCSPAKPQWLLSVAEQSDSNVSAYGRQAKPKIQRVPVLLQQNHQKDGTRLFKPEVVAIGPFHHGDPRLKPMEQYKMAAAKQLAAGTGHAVDEFYDKVRDVAASARECYADLPPAAAAEEALGEEEFASMMFFDGCFLLSFIELYTCNRSSQLQMPTHLLSFVMKDMFLLENQIPLAVLRALMSLKPDVVKLTGFVDKIIGTSTFGLAAAGSSSSSFTLKGRKSPKKKKKGTGGATTDRDVVEDPAADEACHLLDLLRTRFLGPEEDSQYHQGSGSWNAFRSGTELKEVGIRFRKSGSRNLRDVQFENGVTHSWLSLPPLVVDDLTRSRFLNLIALEMCPDGRSDYGITSYVWLMDRIIDRPEDVRELRAKGVLLNELGSDQQAADLFNELATDLSPDRRAYLRVINGINRHYNNKCRVSVVKMLNTHFGTPWSAIAFFAGVFLIVLTVVQTVFTVWPPGHGDAPPAPPPLSLPLPSRKFINPP